MADVLKVQPIGRLQLTKNTNKVLFDQLFQPASMTFTVFSAQAVAIAASNSRLLDFGAIVAGRHCVVQVSAPVNLKINGSATVLPLKANGLFFVSSSSLTSVKAINPNTTNPVTVNYGITD